MKSSTKSAGAVFKDIFVVIFCLLGIGTSVFLFYKAINRSFQNTESESVAIITFKYRTAQRRFENRLVWEWLQNNAEIYNGDHIRTAGLSEAILHFNDNTIINIDENTLIQVHIDEEKSLLPVFLRREKKLEEKVITNSNKITEKTIEKSAPQIIVSSGTITVNTTDAEYKQPVSIMAGNSKINASQDTHAVFSVIEGVVEVQTMKGQVEIESDDLLENVIVEEGKKASINKETKNIELTKISVTEPERNAYYIVYDENLAPVTFKYSLEENDTEAMLELSGKEDFSELYTYMNLETSHNGMLIEKVPEGRWKWRIHQKLPNGKTTVTSEGSFNVYKSQKLQTYLPAEESEYIAEFNEDSGIVAAKVMLSWKNERRAIKYFVRTECAATGEKLEFYSDVSTCMVEIPYKNVDDSMLDEKWTWSVTPVFPDKWNGEILSSDVSTFYVLSSQKQYTDDVVAETENEEIENESNGETDIELEDLEEDNQILTEKTVFDLSEEPVKLKTETSESKVEENKSQKIEAKKNEPQNSTKNETIFEEEQVVLSENETKTTVIAPVFELHANTAEEQLSLSQTGKSLKETEFSDASVWRVRTDKSSGGLSTASHESVVIDYDGTAYSGIKFTSQINASSVHKYNATLFMSNLTLPDSLYEADRLIFKVIGDGNIYTLRLGVGNIEYGCKLKTSNNEVLQFEIPYKMFRQQTGFVLQELDPYEITGLTLSPSDPVPGKYELTIFDMTAK